MNIKSELSLRRESSKQKFVNYILFKILNLFMLHFNLLISKSKISMLLELFHLQNYVLNPQSTDIEVTNHVP